MPIETILIIDDEPSVRDVLIKFMELGSYEAYADYNDVMDMVEGCVQRIFKEALDLDITVPFPRMDEMEAMTRFGIDRPDTRYAMELTDITEQVKACDFRVFNAAIEAGGVVKCLVAKGGESLTRKVLDGLTEDIKGIGGTGMPRFDTENQDDYWKLAYYVLQLARERSEEDK